MVQNDLDDGDRPGEPIDPSDGPERCCPDVTACTSREAYERWADGTEAAVTIGPTMAEGFPLARAIGGPPTVSTDTH